MIMNIYIYIILYIYLEESYNNFEERLILFRIWRLISHILTIAELKIETLYLYVESSLKQCVVQAALSS